ncbi:hypothetical protein [Anaerophilus nitritogenes]|uniref:hypothetical protein n=1 Tax=Anaerophilus nitritogenes TaxID=2498136 RepID=UPI00101C8C92|nr:hypothetical protein [Anaerophilus nitritogenes]
MLKNQVKIYSVDTNSFLNKDENEIMTKIKGLKGYIKQLKEFTLIKLIDDINDRKITFQDADKGIEVYRYNEESNKKELVEDIQLSTFLLKIKNKNTIEKVYKRKPTRYKSIERNGKFIVEIFKENKYHFESIEDYIIQLTENKNKKYIRKYVNRLMKDNKQLLKDKSFKNLMNEIDDNYIKYETEKYITKKGKSGIKKVDIGYKAQIKKLEIEFKKLIRQNKETRQLNKVNKYGIVSIFESDLTRILGLESNELSEDLIIVRAYHYPVMKSLIDNGFVYKNEKYRYFSSSANQIKKRKLVMIKENIWNQFQMRLMCGLTIEDINKSAERGCNINKFLSYLSLVSTASNKWEDVLGKKFNIDECIVIDDFATILKNRTVDYIKKTRESRDVHIKDENSKKIKDENGKYKTTKEEYWLLSDEAERCEKDITIEHSDGAGWILPSLSKKNFQFRLNWMKGLLTPVDFISWCDQYNDGDYKVKDIWGKEWDLKEDNIKIVFGKSQLKMWKYYSSWEDYKDKFKKYNCQANICNMEADEFKKSSFNYQMWQTLEECNPKVINRFTKKVDKLVTKAYTDKETMLKLLGATKENKSRNYLQDSLMIYPELLQDYHIQDQLSDCISKIKKDSSEGKFKLDKAHYTYLVPDVFAWLQFVFKGKDKVTGLLEDGQVYCNLFDTEKYSKLLVNRSPALYKEHCVRNNVTSKKMDQWFITDGVYTSCHDMISKIIMNDVDGDSALVISDSDIILQAENNMKGTAPLFYEMGKAPATTINSENIYNSLTSAFQYGNIGEYSNKLTKLWNRKNYDKDGNVKPFSKEEKEERLNIAKSLCCSCNFSIDASKTLEMVEVSDKMKKQLCNVDKYKLPYFFRYVKDKDITEVEEINDSTVNTITKKIESIKQGDFDFSCVGKFNKNRLMNNIHVDITTDTAKEVIEKYKELNKEMQKYFMYVNNYKDDEDVSKESICTIVYDSLYLDFESFCESRELDVVECVDIIIKHIYKSNKNGKKGFLFNVFGDIILSNLKKNIKPKKMNRVRKGYAICPKCKKEFKKEHNRQKYCSDKCKKEVRKEQDRERKRVVNE